MDIQVLVDEFVEENYGEVSNDDLAYHFYQLGMKDAKQQMMKDAIEKRVFLNFGMKRIELYEGDLKGLEFGDKVKLIIVKEDEK